MRRKIKIYVSVLILTLISSSSYLVAGDLIDYRIAKERNRTTIIVATILGVTIGGSIIFAVLYKKKKK
jgi:prepilin signal peptidase PulO-like enzyme (type II secretory pathway)